MPSPLVFTPAIGPYGTVFTLKPVIFAALLAISLSDLAHAQDVPAPAAASSSSTEATSGPKTTPRRTFYIEPRVTATQSFTDNALLTDANKRADSITQASAGIRAASDAGRIRGYFDYSLNKLIYAKSTEKSTTTNSLNTFGTAEMVDNWAFVDFNGNISRQSLSAFGTQVPDGSVNNPNSTEVASYRLSPYVRGKAFGNYEYEARYTAAVMRSKSTAASDMDQKDASLRVGSDRSLGRLSWSADLSRQEVDYTLGRDTQADRVRLVLNYSISPQLGVFAIAGRENNNYATINKESHGSGGAGVNWSISDRTKFSAEAERRFFARTHKINFEHRTPRTIWKYTDSKDVQTNPGQGGGGSVGTLFDLFFAQFASIEPDPILRAQMVNAFLQANGLNPNAPGNSGFIASGVTVQRRQDLSFALLGVRDTVTVVASRNETSRIQGVVPVGDDLALTPSLDQQSLSVSYAHRLTPDASLNVLAMHQKTKGAAGQSGSTLKSLNVSVSSRLGLKVTGTLGARHVVFDGLNPYTENAVTGSLNVQF